MLLASGSYSVYFWLIKPWAEQYHVTAKPIMFTITTSDPGQVGFNFQQSYARGAVTFPVRVLKTEIPQKSDARRGERSFTASA
jgi:hypothetical protein